MWVPSEQPGDAQGDLALRLPELRQGTYYLSYLEPRRPAGGSKVSHMFRELDEAVREFRSRSLEEAYPYLRLDAPCVKMRRNRRIVNLSIGVRETGERETLALGTGPSEREAFRKAFLRWGVRQGSRGEDLAASEVHDGSKAAVARQPRLLVTSSRSASCPEVPSTCAWEATLPATPQAWCYVAQAG